MDDVAGALQQFLDYGEESFNPDKPLGVNEGQRGYFSGNGWAARVVRWHLKRLREQAVSGTPPRSTRRHDEQA